MSIHGGVHSHERSNQPNLLYTPITRRTTWSAQHQSTAWTAIGACTPTDSTNTSATSHAMCQQRERHCCNKYVHSRGGLRVQKVFHADRRLDAQMQNPSSIIIQMTKTSLLSVLIKIQSHYSTFGSIVASVFSEVTTVSMCITYRLHDCRSA